MRKKAIFRWIYPKIMGKGQFFGALRAHKILILLNFAQKSLSCNPPPTRAFRRIFTHAYTWCLAQLRLPLVLFLVSTRRKHCDSDVVVLVLNYKSLNDQANSLIHFYKRNMLVSL